MKWGKYIFIFHIKGARSDKDANLSFSLLSYQNVRARTPLISDSTFGRVNYNMNDALQQSVCFLLELIKEDFHLKFISYKKNFICVLYLV